MVDSATVIAVQREAGLEFEEFFHREHRRLGKALFLLTGDASEAEDLTQEAMARTYERWDRVGRMDSPAGYVYMIAANLHRRRLRRRAVLSRILPFALDSTDPVVTAEARADLLRAMAGLSVQQREALVLVEWLGYGADEAGRLLGIEAVSVRARLHRAREALRRELGGSDE